MDTETNTLDDEYVKLFNEKFKRIEEIISKLGKKIDNVLELLQNQTDDLHNVNGSCKKMNEHIDFVENVYTHVKNPLGYVIENVNKLMRIEYGSTQQTYSLDDVPNSSIVRNEI